MRTPSITLGSLVCCLLAGCTYSHLPRSGTRYYAGEVSNADLVLSLTPSRKDPGVYLVRTAPVRIGNPVPGWEISVAQAKRALQGTQSLLPLRLRPGYLGDSVYYLNLHYENRLHEHCYLSMNVGAALIPRSSKCMLFSVPSYTPISGPDWRLMLHPAHAFYPLS
jgi:hypothetical protein